MDKVLIVDGNEEFLETTKAGLQKVHQFEILTSTDGRDAVSLLAAHSVSVLAADMEIPGMDALELLAHMSQKHYKTPCIVMIDRGKPWFKEPASQQSFLYHLEKPFRIGSLVSAIFVGLNLRDEGSNNQGMTMASLLPLLEIQQKTCRMQVSAPGKRTGFLYFENGEIIDAHCKDLSVHEAAMQIASWNQISFSFSELPRRRTRRRVKTKLMDFADATWSTGQNTSDVQDVQKEADFDRQSEALRNEEEFEGEDFDIVELLDEVKPDIPGRWAEEIVDRIADMLEQADDARAFRLISVFEPEGQILAARQAEVQKDFSVLVRDLEGFWEAGRQTAEKAGIDPADSLILHGENGGLILRRISSAFNGQPLWALVVCEAGTNWHFVKACLDTLV